MLRALDNGKLTTDLDAAFFRIRNLGTISPPPSNLITTDDPRLSDARAPIDGSVTNFSVADNAGIQQGKLSLSGDLPLNFLGTTILTAAQGDLVQPISEKDQPNGYSSLNVDGKMPSGSTPTSGTGTLHEIDFAFPIGEVTIESEMAGFAPDWTFTGFWAAQDAGAWFGNFSGSTAKPTFDARVFTIALIPGFDASRITSGTFEIDRLPIAAGVGVGHSAGLLPDPGNTATDSTAQPTDYVGRNMEYHAMKPVVSYQPMLSAPSITIQSYLGTNAYVNITQSVAGSNLFYAVGNNAFTEIFAVNLPLSVQVGDVVQAYAAKIGYNNSEITVYTIPPVPTS